MPATLDDVVNALNGISGQLAAIIAMMQNAPGWQVLNIPVGQVNTQISLTDLKVPDNFSLFIQSDPGNAGIISVSSHSDPTKVVHLLKGQPLTLRVTDISDIFITGNVATDIVVLACEKKPQ